MTSPISSPIRLSRRAKALLLSPFVILVGAAARLIIVSNGDTTVATSIAAASGVTGSLLGTVIPLLPPYLPLLVLIFVLFRRLVLASVLAAAAVLVSPAYASAGDGWIFAISSIPKLFNHALHGEWGLLQQEAPGVIACVILGILFAFWGISEVTRDATGVLDTIFAQARYVLFGLACGVICTFGLLFMLAVYRVPFNVDYASQIARRPWLPAEEIQTKSDEERVGYVISTADGWFLLMNESERSLEYIPADEVVSRVVCTPRSYSVEYRSPLIDIRGSGKPAGEICAASVQENEL